MKVKAVIDTNVLVSAFLTKNPDSPTIRVVRAILSGEFELVCSQGIVEEYAEVLGRGYLNLPTQRVEELVGHIRLVGMFVTPADSDESFPDATDKVFYCTALAENAFLVTGNMKHYPPADFLRTPAQFCEMIGI